jgi:TRAP-type C4-dicarboxylate transport system permease small subunit
VGGDRQARFAGDGRAAAQDDRQLILRAPGRMLRWLAACEDALAALGSAIFAFITLAICAEVLLRYGFNRPLTWVVEVSEYALLWMTFLGTSWVLRQGGHVRVDILMQFFSPAALRICGLVSAGAGILAALVLVIFGANATWTAVARGSFKPTGLDIPTWLVLVIIPVGGLLLLARFSRMFVEYHRGARDFGTEPGH